MSRDTMRRPNLDDLGGPYRQRLEQLLQMRREARARGELPEETDNYPRREVRCEICGDTGWCVTPRPYWDPEFGQPVRCRCKADADAERRRAQAQAAQTALLANSNLVDHAHERFETFDPRVPGTTLAYRRAKEYVRGGFGGCLALFGGCGGGKTHLAAAVAWEAFEAGMSVFFADVSKLLKTLQGGFRAEAEHSYDALIEAAFRVDVLVLDDLGTQAPTPWRREQIYLLLNDRYVRKASLIVTSNVQPHELGPREHSRLSDPEFSGGIITLTAGDYRRRGEVAP